MSIVEVPSLMASFAVAEILCPESPLVVMAGRAALGSPRGVMHQRLWRCDLSCLRHPGLDVVTIITTEPLAPTVPGMTEIHPVSVRLRTDPRKASLAVTR
jgi:hypothetical protein